MAESLQSFESRFSPHSSPGIPRSHRFARSRPFRFAKGAACILAGVTLHTMLTTSDELLYVGVSQAAITPPVGFTICGPEFSDRASRGVDDDLSVRCVVFKSYGETAAVVSLDVWGIADWLREGVVKAVEEISGIPSGNVVVVCTGNGTSPPLWRDEVDLAGGYKKYVGYLSDVVAGVVLDAALSLEPAAVGTVSGTLPNLSCFADRVDDEELEEERERLMLTVVQDAEGDVVCLLYSFACPATIVGDTGLWTADYPGIASGTLEQAGIRSAIFVQGASADVRPFDWWEGNEDVSHAGRTWEDAQAFGILLATQAMRAASNVVARRNAVIKTAMSDDGEGVALRIGDAILVSSRDPRPTRFASELRRTVPEAKLLVSANTRGCVSTLAAKRTPRVGIEQIRALLSRIYP